MQIFLNMELVYNYTKDVINEKLGIAYDEE